VGLSLLLHVLLIALAFVWLKTPAQSKAPSYYRINLVDIPAPAPRASVPEAPSEVAVPRPPAPGAALKAPSRAPEGAGRRSPVLGPTALFDREAIKSTATSSAREEAAREDGVTFDTRDMMYRAYLDDLRQKVESIWRYPRKAAEQGIYGDLIIRFVILKDGSLGEVKVVRTSGHRMLDTAAVEALRQGVPYWPLPDGWDRNSLPITGRFIYNINGGYIR
jgi:TonB family protein